MGRRLTAEARRAVVAAKGEALAEGASEIDCRHLAIGSLAVEWSWARLALSRAGGDPDRARQALARPPKPGARAEASLPFNRAAKRALQLALRESLGLHSTVVATDHLLVGAVAAEDGDEREVSAALAIDVAMLRGAAPIRNVAARPHGLRERVRALIPLGGPGDTEAILDPLIARGDRDVEAHARWWKAKALLAAGRPGSALAEVEALRALTGMSDAAAAAAGGAHMLRGAFPSAVAEFEQALARDREPDRASAVYLGLCRALLGDPERGAQLIDEQLHGDLTPGVRAAALIGRAEAELLRPKRDDEAVAALLADAQPLVERFPVTRPWFLRVCARRAAERGDRDEARQLYGESARHSGNRDALHSALALAQLDLEDGLAVTRERATSLREQAVELEARGLEAEALEQLAEVLRRAGETAEARVALAGSAAIYAELDRPDAQRRAERALRDL